MRRMRTIAMLAILVMLVGASTAHVGKQLTTGLSGGPIDSVECKAVNVSETKTIGCGTVAAMEHARKNEGEWISPERLTADFVPQCPST
jgi:hypothetical protein